MATRNVNPDGTVQRRGAPRRSWLRIVGIVVVVIVLILVVAPFFINANAFRPMLESKMSAALERKVTLGHLSFSLWSGSIVADNVAVADDPAFSNQPFLQAKSLHIGVDTGAFIFHHQVDVRQFVADSPEIQLISNQQGKWNYSTLGQNGSAAGQTSGDGGNTNFSVGQFKIENGTATVSSVPSTGRPFTYSNVNFTVQNVSTTTPMPFQLMANLPGNGTVQLNGTAGPINQQDTSATPLQASLTVKHFDPVTAGVLPASEGLSMVADVTAQLQSNGHTMTSSGKANAQHLLLSRNGTPAAQPVDLDYQTTYDLDSRSGQLQDLAVHTGDVAAHLTGTFKMTPETVDLNLHLAAPNLPVNGVEALLPAVGIRLPSGSTLQGGTINASLAITGTAKAPEIKGPVEIDNTKLAGFDLGSKIQGLKALTGTSGGTDIRKVSADVDSTLPSTALSNIDAEIPAIGTATGNGRVSAAGALDFQLVAKLSQTGGMGGVISGAASALGGLAGNLLHTAVSNGVPLTIVGTTSNPVIRANVTQMLKGGLSAGPAGQKQAKPNLGNVLKGLLGPK